MRRLLALALVLLVLVTACEPLPDSSSSSPVPTVTKPATHRPTLHKPRPVTTRPVPKPPATPTAKPATRSPAGLEYAAAWPVPNDHLTPGALVPGCTYPRQTPRHVTATTEHIVSGWYGVPNPDEYDHREPYKMCGADNPANIWPESGDRCRCFGINRKDQLEQYAYKQIDAGVPWRTVVAWFAPPNDWRVLWCRYVHAPGVVCPAGWR